MKKLLAGALSGIALSGLVWVGGSIVQNTKETVHYLDNVIIDQHGEINRLEGEVQQANTDIKDLEKYIKQDTNRLPNEIRKQVREIWED